MVTKNANFPVFEGKYMPVKFVSYRAFSTLSAIRAIFPTADKYMFVKYNNNNYYYYIWLPQTVTTTDNHPDTGKHTKWYLATRSNSIFQDTDVESILTMDIDRVEYN